MPKEVDGIASEVAEKSEDRGLEAQPRETIAKGIRATLEQWQSAIDERVRAIIQTGPSLSEIQLELSRLADRLSALEAKAAEKSSDGEQR